MPFLRPLALIFMCILLLTGCERVHEWHQKLTVTVQTPQGEVQGSSVIAVTKRNPYGPLILPEAGGVKTDIMGEAVVVPLPNAQYLFVLLRGQGGMAHGAFEEEIPYERSSEFDRWARQVRRYDGPANSVPRDYYPRMVSFTDLSDPLSVFLVDPDDLSASFGPGYAMTGMTLEITDEPVTRGRIDPVLPWVEEMHPSLLDGQSIQTLDAENKLANSLGTGNFLIRGRNGDF